MSTRAVFSSAYHLQTDGKAKRVHRTIEQAIRFMLAERSKPPEAWCEVAGALELRLNTAVSGSTGKPPALAELGEMSLLPGDLIVGTELRVGAQNVATQVEVIVEEARKQLAKAQEYQKPYYGAYHCQ